MLEIWYYTVDVFYSLSLEAQVFIITIALFSLVFHLSYTSATANKAPAFLTTLGIFGTFVGIAIGLLHFDTSDITRSVPALIEGIKTSVWASAAGIFAALTIKLRDIEGFRKRRKKTHKSASLDDLVGALQSLEQALLRHERLLSPEPVLSKPVEIPKQPMVEIVRIETPLADDESYQRNTQF